MPMGKNPKAEKVDPLKSPSSGKNGSTYKKAKRESRSEFDSDPAPSTVNSRYPKKPKLDVDETFNGNDSDNDSGEGSKHEKTPKEMHAICKKLLDSAEARNINLSKKRASHSFDSIIKDCSFDIGMNAKETQSLFRNYYKSASSLRNTPMNDAIKRVMEYTEDEGCVLEHPNYPKRPQIPYNIFCRKKGLTWANIPKSVVQEFHQENNPLVVECKEEAKQDRIRFMDNLRQFLVDFEDSLFPNQVNFVKNKLRRLEREDPAYERKRAKPMKFEKLTAFDFFKNTKKQKYTELPEKEREAKLQRHFDKLDSDKKEIFESLAANQ